MKQANRPTLIGRNHVSIFVIPRTCRPSQSIYRSASPSTPHVVSLPSELHHQHEFMQRTTTLESSAGRYTHTIVLSVPNKVMNKINKINMSTQNNPSLHCYHPTAELSPFLTARRHGRAGRLQTRCNMQHAICHAMHALKRKLPYVVRTCTARLYRSSPTSLSTFP